MIPIEDIHALFDLWIDKVGAPYFDSGQKDLFIQRAAIHFINQYFKNPSSHIMEDTHVDLEDVTTLVNSVDLVTNSQGEVTFSQVNQQLPQSKEWMYFLNVGRGKTKDCSGKIFKSRWVRHNDYLSQQANAFKRAEEDYPIHRYFSDKLRFDPTGERACRITVLVYPNKVTLDDPNDTGQRGTNAIDLDLPSKVFNEIVYLALTQAGINMREQDFYTFVEREVSKNV